MTIASQNKLIIIISLVFIIASVIIVCVSKNPGARIIDNRGNFIYSNRCKQYDNLR